MSVVSPRAGFSDSLRNRRTGRRKLIRAFLRRSPLESLLMEVVLKLGFRTLQFGIVLVFTRPQSMTYENLTRPSTFVTKTTPGFSTGTNPDMLLRSIVNVHPK